MAEIDIEEKKKNKNKNNKNIGLYIIIAILLIAGLIWWLSSGDDNNELEIIRPTVMEQSLPDKTKPDYFLSKNNSLEEEALALL